MSEQIIRLQKAGDVIFRMQALYPKETRDPVITVIFYHADKRRITEDESTRFSADLAEYVRHYRFNREQMT